MRRKLLTLVVAIVVIVSLAVIGCAKPAPAPTPTPTPAPGEEVIEWVGQVHQPEAAALFRGWQRLTERIEEASNGRLVLDLYPANSICPATGEPYAVDKGAIDFGNTAAILWAADIPSASLFGGPVGGMSVLPFTIWFDSAGGGEMWERALAPLLPNTKIFGDTTLILGSEVWAHSTKKLASLKDMKGLKMRTAGDGGIIFERLGASSVSLPPGEIYEALSRGVIDAMENSGPASNWSYGYQEIAPYVYLSSSRGPVECNTFLVNKDKWEELPTDLQALVLDELRANRGYVAHLNLYEDVLAIQKYVDYGCEVLAVPEDIEKAMLREARSYYGEQAAKDPLFNEIWTSQNAWSEQYEGYMDLLEVPSL